MNSLRMFVVAFAITMTCFCSLPASIDAWQSTSPNTQRVEDTILQLERRFNERETNKASALQQLKEHQQCNEFFNHLMEGYDLIRKDALQRLQDVSTEVRHLLDTVKPITDLRREEEIARTNVGALRSQLQLLEAEVKELTRVRTSEERSLDRMRQGQKEAMRTWLLREYGEKVGPVTTVELGGRVTVSLNTLFGTFFADYYHQLTPDAGQQTTVTFAPAVFAKDLLLSNFDLAPDGYSRPIPDGLKFEEATVAAEGSDRPFKLKQREQIRPEKPIRWSWATQATDQFRGADFDILINAFHEEPNIPSVERTVARLPIKIKREPEKTFWEKYASLVGPSIGALVAGFFVAPICYFAGNRRGRKKREIGYLS